MPFYKRSELALAWNCIAKTGSGWTIPTHWRTKVRDELMYPCLCWIVLEDIRFFNWFKFVLNFSLQGWHRVQCCTWEKSNRKPMMVRESIVVFRTGVHWPSLSFHFTTWCYLDDNFQGTNLWRSHSGFGECEQGDDNECDSSTGRPKNSTSKKRKYDSDEWIARCLLVLVKRTSEDQSVVAQRYRVGERDKTIMTHKRTI